MKSRHFDHQLGLRGKIQKMAFTHPTYDMTNDSLSFPLPLHLICMRHARRTGRMSGWNVYEKLPNTPLKMTKNTSPLDRWKTDSFLNNPHFSVFETSWVALKNPVETFASGPFVFFVQTSSVWICWCVRVLCDLTFTTWLIGSVLNKRVNEHHPGRHPRTFLTYWTIEQCRVTHCVRLEVNQTLWSSFLVCWWT